MPYGESEAEWWYCVERPAAWMWPRREGWLPARLLQVGDHRAEVMGVVAELRRAEEEAIRTDDELDTAKAGLFRLEQVPRGALC